MATHSTLLAWRIPWREEPGGQQSESDTTEWLSRRAPRGYHLQRPPWAQKTRAEGLGAKQDGPSREAVFWTETRLSLALDVWGEVERSKEKNWVREQ